MPADIWDIVLEKGSDFEAVLEFFDDDGNIDISTDTFTDSIKENINDPDVDVKASFTFVPFQDVDDDNKWKVRMTLSDTLINALSIKTGVHDMFREFTDGFRAKPLKGSVTVDKKVTP